MAGALSLSSRIEEGFLRRFDALPDDARRLLLVAAAEPTGDPALLLRAAERAWDRRPSVGHRGAADLLEVGARVRFRHPLIRSAVYRTASTEGRRAVHLALASATDAHADPDRRAWHHAEATPGPNEEVAAELERAADRARARGGLAAASAFLERATALTAELVPACRARAVCGTGQIRGRSVSKMRWRS